MRIKAPDAIGGEYQSYAPGHGALAFVHVVNDKATNEPVPRPYAKMLLPDDDWMLSEVNGRLEGHRIVKRIADNKLVCGDDVYTYEMRKIGNSVFYEFWFLVDDEWEILRNESRRSSLKYFLTHESLLDKPLK